MIGMVCVLLLGILAVRSLILAVAESKPWILRIMDFLLALVFGATSILLSFFVVWKWDASLLLLSIPVIIISMGLRHRLRQPYEARPVAFLFKLIFVLVLICGSLMVLMMAGFVYLTEDQPVLKVTMTGNHQKELVEWKNPKTGLHRRNLDAYEVIFDTPEGRRIANLHVYGDQVAVKAKVIRFRPVLNLLGFHNLCRIEYMYNGYTTAERFNEYPHLAQKIPLALHPVLSSFQERFWGIWSSSFYQEQNNWWIKSATLESTYFPLVNADGNPFRGAYYLTVTPGGLSGVPLP